MARKVIVRPHEYYDSVRLMQVSERVRGSDGVSETIVMMATDNNKKLLAAAGLLIAEAAAAGPDDLVIGIVAASETQLEAALTLAVECLTQRATGAVQQTHRTLDSALAALPAANLAVIAVPGDYAAAEARRALERHLHVLLFSDNVSVADEVALKRQARACGRLLMGPDCGTALINGAGLGFANAVRRGGVGIVGASGTGIQELCVLLDRGGAGISHAIGTGGRDLSEAVGGITMLMGIDQLEADVDTALIVITSKPPAPMVAQRVLARAAACSKPVVVNFLGGDAERVAAAGVTAAATLEQAARAALYLLSGAAPAPLPGESDLPALAAAQAQRLLPEQRHLRALYSGGTLGYEALLILEPRIGDIQSNIALRADCRMPDPWSSRGHTLVDLGDDVFTRGRAHPMIDPALRVQRLLGEAEDAGVAVILFDVVLGYGAHDNPAQPLAEAVARARQIAAGAGRQPVFVAAVCGTEADPQCLSQQQSLLREAGVLVAASNAQAARLAAAIIDAARAAH